jgi:hypothetical protein
MRIGAPWRANLPAIVMIVGGLTLFWGSLGADVRGALIVALFVVILAILRSARSARRTRLALAAHERAIAELRARGARERARLETPPSPPHRLRLVRDEPTPSPSPLSSPASSPTPNAGTGPSRIGSPG